MNERTTRDEFEFLKGNEKKAGAFNFTLFHFISSLHKENNNNNIRERDTHTLGLDLFVFVDETIALLLHVTVAKLLPQVS